LKVALVHDALINCGGAERVFQVFCEMFQNAPIYTSVYLPEKTFPYFQSRRIFTTVLQKFIKSEQQLKQIFPLSLWLMPRIVLKDFDLVLSSSTFCGKYIKVLKPTIHICYCYTPFRLLWQTESYFNEQPYLMKRYLLIAIARIFRSWDYRSAQKVNFFITMTPETKERILKSYNRDSTVIYPPIDCSKYKVSSRIEDYFLMVSRLEPYKKVDIAVNAFNKLGMKLKIIGNGSQKAKILERSHKNIEVIGNVPDEELKEYLARCRAVIFPQREDFGLVPLEANASGRPVIAFGEGGIFETMVPFDGENLSKATALFFYSQTEYDLINAIRKFEEIEFNVSALVENAKRFDKVEFTKKMELFLKEKLKQNHALAADLS
jgi:glycosyltransferase involved in cell wall biosynthesis